MSLWVCLKKGYPQAIGFPIKKKLIIHGLLGTPMNINTHVARVKFWEINCFGSRPTLAILHGDMQPETSTCYASSGKQKMYVVDTVD